MCRNVLKSFKIIKILFKKNRGKFFKLGKNSQYKEITEFTVEQYKYEKCTSDKFSAAFGIEACLKLNRPNRTYSWRYQSGRYQHICSQICLPL